MVIKTTKTALRLLILAAIIVPLGVLLLPEANAGGYPWKDHARPFDFEFGNNIDTHQQSRIKANGERFGFL